MWHTHNQPVVGALSREERQRRQQLSPEARRAVRSGEAASRRADRSAQQDARRQTDLNLAAIRNEKDPAAKQALIDALSPEDKAIRDRRQGAGQFLRDTASTATSEGGTQTLLEQGQGATTDRATSWVERQTGVRVQLPGIRTTPSGGAWLKPDTWTSANLKRYWKKGKKAAPGTVFFPKSRGIDVPYNEGLDNLNAIKSMLDAIQQKLAANPALTADYNRLARAYLEVASGFLRNAVYASGAKQGQAVDEFGVVVIYAFTTRNIKVPANSAGFALKGGVGYTKWLKREVRKLKRRADATPAPASPRQAAPLMVSRAVQDAAAPGAPQVHKAGMGGPLVLGVLLLGGGALYFNARKKSR